VSALARSKPVRPEPVEGRSAGSGIVVRQAHHERGTDSVSSWTRRM